jgi:hypothetical protein
VGVVAVRRPEDLGGREKRPSGRDLGEEGEGDLGRKPATDWLPGG